MESVGGQRKDAKAKNQKCTVVLDRSTDISPSITRTVGLRKADWSLVTFPNWGRDFLLLGHIIN